MKFILMMHAPRQGWETSGIGTWPPEDIKTHIGFMMNLNKDLREAGTLVSAEGLDGPERARLVRARAGGGAPMTDGPFPEAKEFLAGFWIIDVESAEDAYASLDGRSRGSGTVAAPTPTAGKTSIASISRRLSMTPKRGPSARGCRKRKRRPEGRRSVGQISSSGNGRRSRLAISEIRIKTISTAP